MNMNNDFESGQDWEDEEFISKSQVKREMVALQKLGERLVAMKSSALNEVPMSEELRAAIDHAQAINAKEAKRRQLQFIGKLMRREDADAISASIEQFDTSSERYARELHLLENWRERLLTDNKALTEFLNEYPQVDIQALRNLIRAAQKDLKNGKNTGQQKKLFRLLKESIRFE
ncbi:hypothetical protein OLMES_1886 [Oleiphilus messinensis]|uniref:Dual-action ribosomal maturation protein DarP n=2 Tax=Oleiphilus messinensis TaxID=141451 RepID=A0A1Y0I6V2_9GAMM|nr:hypothetical protein OLMES_1886 [Oleiphilus messinensis]